MKSMRPFLGALALLALLSVHTKPATPPNFVIIMADDLGWNDVGYHGSAIKTPHLDRLAREGVRLERHYVAPMCSPTRAALLTGRYWSRFGVTSATNSRVLPFETITLASALKSAGYDTAITGKWHLGSKPEWGPNHFGFDHAYGSLAGGTGPYDHRYKTGPYSHTWHRNGKLIEEEGHVTDLIAREAISWIQQRTERPFFLYVAFTAPHIPIHEPEAWLRFNDHVADPSQRLFAACVSHLDDAVGRIVRTLEASGKLDDTLVLFFSDNGATPRARNDDPLYPPGPYLEGPCGGSNLPLRGNKTELYEGGIRTPALAYWPKRLKPGQRNAPFHIADWMPTLTGLAGFRSEQDLKWDGRQVWAILSGEAPDSLERVLYWEGVRHRMAAVRSGDWKLLVQRADRSKDELFDLRHDPNETANLASRHPERVAELSRLLQDQTALDNDAPGPAARD